MRREVPLRYVLITPARNEAAHIEKTITSVVSQTVLPSRWVIVSDGSTDLTDEIAKRYAEEHSWIELIRMPDHEDRHFASKVFCFNAGYDRVRSLDFEIIGNLDADLSFEPDYFEFLLAKFIEFPNLGVAGTPFIQESSQYDYRFTNIDHVSGACQLFRRSCFEDVGGYVPIKEGGIDWVAVTTARMKGWTTRTFLGKSLYHYRKMGTGKSSPLGALFKLGKQDYSLGNHPLWEFLRMFYQMRFNPYVVSGLILFAGFMTAAIQAAPRPISLELITFIRKEQIRRLLERIPLMNRRRKSHEELHDKL